MQPADILDMIAVSVPAQALKASFWAYPLVNAGHILGLALLIGAIVPLDIRILGGFRSVPLRALARVCVPIAAGGLALSVLTGIMLFIVKPHDYAGSQLFLIKLVAIGVGVINVAAVRANPLWAEITQGAESLLDPTEGDLHLKLAALLSMLVWIGVLVMGRLVGYFL